MSEKKRSKDAGKWFREMKSELKKVVWPTLPQVVKNTAIVIAMSMVIALFIGVIDFGLKLGVNALLPEPQEIAMVPVDETAETPADQTAETPADETAETPADETAETPAE